MGSQDQPEHAFYEFTFIRFAAPDRPVGKKPTLGASTSRDTDSSTVAPPHPDKNSTGTMHSTSSSYRAAGKDKKTAQPVYV